MMAAGVSLDNTLKRSIPKKPRMVANFRRNAGGSGGFIKIGGGMQSNKRKGGAAGEPGDNVGVI